MTNDADMDALKAILSRHSVRFGEFVLASGATSNVYVDVRQTSLQGTGALLIGKCFHALIRSIAPSARAVGGLTLGADPLVSGTSIAAHLAGDTLQAIIVRKSSKGHGTGQRIEMPRELLNHGDEVVAVDDVATSGGSTLEAIAALRDAGFVVNHALAVVDREAGAEARMASEGITLHTLFRLSDFTEK